MQGDHVQNQCMSDASSINACVLGKMSTVRMIAFVLLVLSSTRHLSEWAAHADLFIGTGNELLLLEGGNAETLLLEM